MTNTSSIDRVMSRMFGIVAVLACLTLSLITLYSSGAGPIDPGLHRAGGFGLALIITVAISGVKRMDCGPSSPLHLGIDLALILAGLWSIWSFYLVQSEMESALYDVTTRDAWPAVAGLVVFLELCRRLWGWGLFGVGTIGVVYLLFGQDLPGIMSHSGFSLKEVAEALWYNTNNGVFGSITDIVLSTVFIFIFLGVLLGGTGAVDTLLKFAFLATRRTRGGPAHAAILASSMFGTMSGSGVANLVGTGTFTIPMIKKRGFSPTFAAGIEATASSGSPLIPPIMGVTALVMADLIGVGYLNIIVATLVPALFYYFSLFSAAAVEARRQGIDVQEMTVDDQITRTDLFNSVLLIGPILVVIGSLLAGLSTSAAGFYALVVFLVLSVINPEVGSNPARIFGSFLEGANSAATLLIAIGTIGIVMGSLDSSGLGLKLANVIATSQGESLFSVLLVVMAGALILGMWIPTLPTYLLIILVMGPTLQELGVSMLTAHMFVFYYCVTTALTPPIATIAYMAANIARSNILMTGFMSFRLGMAKFIIPFIFAFYPTILIIEEFSLSPFLWIVARTCFCIWLFSSALSGFDRRKLTVPEIVIRFVTAFTCLATDSMIHLPSIAIGFALIAFDIHASQSKATTSEASR